MAAIYERLHDSGEIVWRVAIRIPKGRRFCLTFSKFNLAKEWLKEHENWVKKDWDRALQWREDKYDLMRRLRVNEHEGIIYKRFKGKKNGK